MFCKISIFPLSALADVRTRNLVSAEEIPEYEEIEEVNDHDNGLYTYPSTTTCSIVSPTHQPSRDYQTSRDQGDACGYVMDAVLANPPELPPSRLSAVDT